MNKIPLSLYIHFPWCVQKCPYCDFNSHGLRNQDLPEEIYIDQLIRELDHHLNQIDTQPLHSLFLGGGTPSLFSGPALKRLLDYIKGATHTPDSTEITLEANPGTLTNQKYPEFLDAGINRLSIGVQSFNPDHLKKLGRIHNPTQASEAIQNAYNAGFHRINADLMFGLPEQNIEQALDDLDQALNLPISHLSWYQLTLEPNTEFHHRPPLLPNDDQLFDMQQAGQNQIQQASFQQYEVSAYCKNNDRCEHNLNYWQFGDYLGIGAGAHSKITQSDGTVLRMQNEKHPKRYQNPNLAEVIHKQIVPPNELPLEFFLNTFRLHQPIKKTLFAQRTALPLDSIEQAISQAEANDWLTQTESDWQLTDSGKLLLNEVLELFLPH